MGSTSALDAVHGLSTGAKYIEKNGMDLILLLMASRWVQDGFNIGFGCCMMASIWLMMASYGSRCELTSALDAV